MGILTRLKEYREYNREKSREREVRESAMRKKEQHKTSEESGPFFKITHPTFQSVGYRIMANANTKRKK